MESERDIITERNSEIRELELENDLLRGETGSLDLYIRQLKAEATEKDALIAALTEELERVKGLLNELPQKIRDSGKPGPGGIDIADGIPSEIYVAIGRERYDDEYEVAVATAEAERTGIANYVSWMIQKLKEPT